MTPQAAITLLEGLKFPIDQDSPAWKAENNEALDLAIAELKGLQITDDMVERALDFWFTEPESTGINYGDWRKWSTAQQQRDTMRAALTAALHIPIAELNQSISGADMAAPNVE